MKLARRSAFDPTPNSLTRALAKRRAAGLGVLDLTVSNPTTVGLAWPPEVLAHVLTAAENARYQPAPFGLPSARAAVAATAGVEPSRVVLTASTSEAYAFLFKALCDPGDALICMVPGYPLFEQLARLEGVRLIPVPLGFDGAWHVDLPAVRAAISPTVRGILVVSPNNPTGHSLTHAERDALAALGLPLIVDEVFAPYPHDRAAVTALTEAAPVVVLDGLSKRCGLPQMKAGWMIVGGPPAFAEPLLERLEWIADAWLSLATPVQHALPTLLADPAGISAAIHRRTAENLAHLRAAVVGAPLDALSVGAGWYVVLGLPAIASEEAWVLDLLDAGVLVQPGWFYDFERGPYLVVSLLTPPDDFTAGIARIIERVAGSS